MPINCIKCNEPVAFYLSELMDVAEDKIKPKQMAMGTKEQICEDCYESKYTLDERIAKLEKVAKKYPNEPSYKRELEKLEKEKG